MKKGNKVKIIGGNNEVGQPTMIGKTAIVSGLGTKYKVKGKNTQEVYVNLGDLGTHVFNDYHLTAKGGLNENFNKILDEKPLPEKLVKDLNLDDTLKIFEMRKQELKNKISGFKTQRAASKALGMSQSDVSDFMHGEKRRKWSHGRIINAIRRLEND